MAKEAKKATKLEKKLRVLLGGYNVRDNTETHVSYCYECNRQGLRHSPSNCKTLMNKWSRL